MVNYLTSILPIALYLIILKCLDNFRIVRLRTIFVCLLIGIASCVVAALVVWNIDMGAYVCVVEETIKASMAMLLVARKKIVFFVEALVYGATIGSGFALEENIVYLYANPDMLLGTALFRGFSTALLHMGCTALMAVSLLEIKMSRKAVVLLLLPVVIHYCYNLMLIAPLIQMVITVITFLFIFVLINSYNERKIYQWLDHSVTFDIQLLSAIREGRLTDTKSGRYLQTIKSQFQPEVFFDLICFIQLYLEMVIAGKSRLLLEQEGLATPLTTDEINLHNAKYNELQQLRRNIGRLGEHLLRPVININDQDLRMM